MRAFFQEGDLMVAEVQQLYADGQAVLHTRSLRYGKLRTGLFLAAGAASAGGVTGSGVVRSRRQVWTMGTRTPPGAAPGSAGKVDVILGVNGFVWISKHVDEGTAVAAAAAAAAGVDSGTGSITSMEEIVSATMYSSQNDRVEVETMREIARIRGVVAALVENGLRVDEDMVVKGYHEAVDMALASPEGPEDIYLGGQKGAQLAAALQGR